METDFNFKDSKYATGKRKKLQLLEFGLKKGTGKIIVNGKDYDTYFKRANHKMQLLRPFEILIKQLLTMLNAKLKVVD